MGRIFSFLMTSADGYHEGPNRELDFHNVDAEFEDYTVANLTEAEALLFGRVTFDLLSEFWQSDAALRDAGASAERMNALPKYLVSSTKTDADWPTTHIVGFDDLAKLRQSTDIMVCGSSQLVAGLLNAGLLDELRLMVNPVILGAGRPVLAGADRSSLTHVSTRTFGNGNVLITYRPKVQAG